jgi:organic radical activating enzyme
VAFRERKISGLPRSIQNSAKKPPMAAGLGVTRHPGAGAAQQLSVAGGEPLRNEELSSLAAVLRKRTVNTALKG